MVWSRAATEPRAGSFTIFTDVPVGSTCSPVPGFELDMRLELLLNICL